MAFRMGVYYRQPDDPETFEKRYLEEHLPLINAYDNIKTTHFFKTGRSIAGEFPYAFVFIGVWDDKDGWKADLGSEKAKEATKHAQSLGAAFVVVTLDELA